MFIWQDMRDNYDHAEKHNVNLRDENSSLRHDIHTLINVIGTARTKGKWEVRILYK